MEMNYSNAILQLRAKLNLSQENLASLLGVSFTSVNRWENGHNEPTKLVKVRLNELLKDNDIELKGVE